MDTLLRLGIVVASLIILFFAYFKKDKLAILIVFVLLAAILVGDLLGILANIQFLDFLRDAFNTLRSLVIFIEIGLIAFFSFFKFKKTFTSFLGITIIVLLVLLLLVEFNIF